MMELFANNGDPAQIPRSAASDLGLHCLLITFLGVSSLQWVIDKRQQEQGSRAKTSRANSRSPGQNRRE